MTLAMISLVLRLLAWLPTYFNEVWGLEGDSLAFTMVQWYTPNPPPSHSLSIDLQGFIWAICCCCIVLWGSVGWLKCSTCGHALLCVCLCLSICLSVWVGGSMDRAIRVNIRFDVL